jgi:hypothetical protein
VALLLPVFSLVLLGAHFYRAGSLELVALVVALLALLTVRRPWAVRVVQVFLVLGTVEWIMTLGQLVFERAYTDQRVGRLVLILAAVALFTAASTFAFRSPRLRAVYGLGRRPRTGDVPPTS